MLDKVVQAALVHLMVAAKVALMALVHQMVVAKVALTVQEMALVEVAQQVQTRMV